MAPDPDAGLDLWAGAHVGTVAAALARLARMPVSDTGNGVSVPFPFRDRAGYKRGNPNYKVNRAIEEAPIVGVRLVGLCAIQKSVFVDRVARYVREPGWLPMGVRHREHGGLVDYPVVVQCRGTRFIHDGHNRLSALWLRGVTGARVRLVVL